MKIKVIHLSKILLFLTLLVTLLTVGISIVIANSEDYIEVPIIMYHSILKDPSRSNKYTVTPTVLEEDLKYIKDKKVSTNLLFCGYNNYDLKHLCLSRHCLGYESSSL